jgi:hypothetical protein
MITRTIRAPDEGQPPELAAPHHDDILEQAALEVAVIVPRLQAGLQRREDLPVAHPGLDEAAVSGRSRP